MTKNAYKMTIIDAATGEVIERDMTADEQAQHEATLAEIIAEQNAREAAREASITKLAALGLTPEDLAAL